MLLYRIFLTFLSGLIFLGSTLFGTGIKTTEKQPRQELIIIEPEMTPVPAVQKSAEPENTAVEASPEPVKIEEPVMYPLEGTFFDDAVFLGDSITHTLLSYCLDTHALGDAVFLARGSYSLRAACDSRLLPLNYAEYSGGPEEILPHLNAGKIYIMLGLNDISVLSLQEYYSMWSTLVTNIREACPGIQIIFQTVTPVYPGQEDKPLNNDAIAKYNALLKGFALENGCNYIDIGGLFANENGDLCPWYCRDEYVHLTDECAEIWVNALKTRSRYAIDPVTGQMENGGYYAEG